MHTKKLLVGALVLSAVAGGAYYYSQGADLQGRVSGVRTVTPTTVAVIVKPDFYFKGNVSYDDGLNYFEVNVCQTNVKAADVKQTGLQFTANGVSNTVDFTPTVSTAESCQVVPSRDIYSAFGISTSGSDIVDVALDADAEHAEKIETNNGLSSSVVMEPNYYLFDADAMPDLSIEGVELDWTHGLLEVNVCADNALSGITASSVKVSYTATQNGHELEDEERTLPSLSTLDNSCKVVTLDVSGTWSGAVSEGTFDIEMSIDSQDQIPETNEGNNSYNGAVAVDM